MPVQKAVTAYTFDELDEKAKNRAREKAREHACDYAWWDTLYEDADTIAELMGIEIDRRKQRNRAGQTRDHGPDIQFSGFASQGDGASFTGTWKHKVGAPAAVREHAPEDEKLHNIADTLDRLGKEIGENMRATITRGRYGGSYVHEHMVEIDLEDMDETTDSQPRDTNEQEKAIADTLRAYMKWIYRQLEAEYEYLTSDEAVDEMIEANEYLFTEAGSRCAVL